MLPPYLMLFMRRPSGVIAPVDMTLLGTFVGTEGSWLNVPAGPPSPDRIIVLAAAQRRNAGAATPSLSSVVIGGTAATPIAEGTIGVNTSAVTASLWAAPVPAGTTVSASANVSSNTNYLMAGLYAIRGSAFTPADVGQAGAVGPVSVLLDALAGSTIIAAGASNNTVSAPASTFTWGGVDMDDSGTATRGTATVASRANVPAGPHLVSSDGTPLGAPFAMAAAAWGPPGPVSGGFVASYVQPTTAANYRFVAASLGQPAPDRTIVVAASLIQSSTSAQNIATMTINNVPAVRRVLNQASTATYTLGAPTELWTALVPDGAAGDIFCVTANAVNNRKIIGVYALYGLVSPVPLETATDVSVGASATAVAVTLNPAGGERIIAVMGTTAGAGTPAVNWSGAAPDYTQSAAGYLGSAASLAPAAGPHTISAAVAGATSMITSLAAARWR